MNLQKIYELIQKHQELQKDIDELKKAKFLKDRGITNLTICIDGKKTYKIGTIDWTADLFLALAEKQERVIRQQIERELGIYKEPLLTRVRNWIKNKL